MRMTRRFRLKPPIEILSAAFASRSLRNFATLAKAIPGMPMNRLIKIPIPKPIPKKTGIPVIPMILSLDPPI